MARRRFINSPPSTNLSAEAPKDAVKVEFARRLQAAIIRKGWNQSELAREADKHLPRGKKMGRDSISHYIRAMILPGPVKLGALCAALDMKREDLIPQKGFRDAGEDNPSMEMKDIGDGNMWLRINRAVRNTTGAKILQLLTDEDSGDGGGDNGMSKHNDGNHGSHMAIPA